MQKSRQKLLSRQLNRLLNWIKELFFSIACRLVRVADGIEQPDDDSEHWKLSHRRWCRYRWRKLAYGRCVSYRSENVCRFAFAHSMWVCVIYHKVDYENYPVNNSLSSSDMRLLWIFMRWTWVHFHLIRRTASTTWTFHRFRFHDVQK